ncbi:MAG: maleylpyruvate isomerase family mycothiol-dependent enzyme [Acidimicrobiales bacterium]
MNHDSYCEAAISEVLRMADVVEAADPGVDVPSCPGWTLADLIRHVGRVHRWTTAMVRDVAQERYGREQLGDLAMPEDETRLAAWLRAGADPMAQAFRGADPDAPMWAWGADRFARFWPRRMLHETTVHRADAELALDLEPRIDTAIAVDGIDEFLANLSPAVAFAPAVAGLQGDGERLVFSSADGEHGWRVALDTDGFSWSRTSEQDADVTVTVTGLPADLLLLIYGRRTPDDARFTVTGADQLLAKWLQNSAI